MTDLLPCPFCGGEAEFQLDGTQPDISCKECGISYGIQASDHFTREERFDDPGFAFIMEPHYCYAEKGKQRAKDVLTEYWNTRPSQSNAPSVPEDVAEAIGKLEIMHATLEVVKGKITDQPIDAQSFVDFMTAQQSRIEEIEGLLKCKQR